MKKTIENLVVDLLLVIFVAQVLSSLILTRHAMKEI
jgi:hypothetical protein